MLQHVIGKQEFVLTFNSKKNVDAILDDLSLLYNTKITQLIDDIFSEIAPIDNQYIRIDKLELDLGRIDARHIERDIMLRVSDLLGRTLQEQVMSQDKSQLLQAGASGHTALIQYYLLYGSLPWWSASNSSGINQLWETLLRSQPANALQLLKTIGHYSYVRKRLAFEFDTETVWILIELLEKVNSQTIRLYAAELLEVHRRKHVINIDNNHFNRLTLEFIITYLLIEKGSSFNTKMLLKSIIRQLAARYNIDYRNLIALLADAVKDSHWPRSANHSLPFIIKEIFEDESPNTEATVATEIGGQEQQKVWEEKLLRHFLIHGAILWESNRTVDKKEIHTLLAAYLNDSPKKVLTWITKETDKTQIINSISRHLPDKLITSLVKMLQPSEAAFITDYTYSLQQYQHKEPFVATSDDHFRQSMWEVVFLYLLNNRGSLFNTKSFLKYHIARMAAKYRVDYERLLEKLGIMVATVGDISGQDKHRLSSLLQSIQNEYKETHPAENNLLSEPLTIEEVYETGYFTTTARLDIVAHLLLHGSLPWWAAGIAIKESLYMEEWLLQSMEHLPKETERMLKKHSIHDTFIERIASFHTNIATQIVEWLEPTEAGIILLYADMVDKVRKNQKQIPLSNEQFHKVKWQVMLSYLLNDRGSVFNTKSFIKATVAKYALTFNMAYDSLLQLFSQSIKALNPSSQKKSALLTIFAELDKETENKSLIKTQQATAPEKDNSHPKIAFIKQFESWFDNPVSDRKIPVAHHIYRWLNARPAAVKKNLIKFVSLRENAIWLVNQTREENIFSLILWLTEESHAITLLFLQQIETLLSDTTFSKISNKKARFLLLEHTLLLLGSGARIPFSREVYFHELVKFLSWKESISEGAVIFLLNSAIKRKESAAPHPLKEDVLLLKNKIAPEKPANKETTKSTAQEETNKLPPDTTRKNAEELPPEPESVFINNAGLVLLWPFMSRLFDMLELSERGKFHSSQAAYRAVHVLQYLATGAEGYPEYELVLNKVLCGVEVTKPLEIQVQLTDMEKEKSDHLLQAVINQWTILKNTSIDGLRHSFLLRNGKLALVDNARLLTVEKKPYDMLLDHIPWNYKLVKLSWMDKMLNVKWR